MFLFLLTQKSEATCLYPKFELFIHSQATKDQIYQTDFIMWKAQR